VGAEDRPQLPHDRRGSRVRGLAIVAALCEQWGVRWHDDGGKTVWALVRADSPAVDDR
jgi:hypothetical protein